MAGSGSLIAHQISSSAAISGTLSTTNIQMKVEASTRTEAYPQRLRLTRPGLCLVWWGYAGAGSSAVIRRKASKRSSISSAVRRATRSVPNSSTLKEAIAEP